MHWVKALALILVLVVVGWVILSKSSKGPTKAATSTGSTHHSGPTTTTSLPPAPTTTTTLLPAKQVKVQVLNGASVALPLATEWSHKLQTNPGYTTLTPNNATANVSTSAIYVITPGYLPEADQLATAVGLPLTAVDQTIPAPAAAPIPASVRASANLVLVVGPNLQATA